MSVKLILIFVAVLVFVTGVLAYLVSSKISERRAFEVRCTAMGGVYILTRYDLKCIKGTELYP